MPMPAGTVKYEEIMHEGNVFGGTHTSTLSSLEA
jgi:hypothetical protein